MQNPMVQQFNLGVEYEFAKNWLLKVDGIHDLGTHFIIGGRSDRGLQPRGRAVTETVTDLQSSREHAL